MPDLRRISLAAGVLLVVLRIAIGWQLLYEGLWKIDSFNTANPWSAKGYLTNAQGPFRETFRSMAGDPDDLDWLDYGAVAARWDDWLQRFREHYDLTDQQWTHLKEMVDGPQVISVAMTHDPVKELNVRYPGKLAKQHDFGWGEPARGRALWWDEVDSQDDRQNRLRLDPRVLMLPGERAALKRQARVIREPKTPENKRHNVIALRFERAVDDLYVLAHRVGESTFKIRLRAMLAGDPDRAGQILVEQQGTIDYHWPGDIDQYRHRLQRYRQHLAAADTLSDYDHLAYDWAEIQELRGELIAPVLALEEELKRTAYGTFRNRRSLETGKAFDRILTDEQRLDESQAFIGTVPDAWQTIDTVDWLTIWCLVIFGVLLMTGTATRAAAVLAAGMLLSFYLVWPPWPGVPEPPGAEHSFIVNKNVIESIALLVIAALPTGTWFGLDGVFHRMAQRWRMNGHAERD